MDYNVMQIELLAFTTPYSVRNDLSCFLIFSGGPNNLYSVA